MMTAIFGLLAETPIHPGSGRTMGVIDLPIAREATTDHPVLVGSSLKGALRDKLRSREHERTAALFGKPDQAGELLVSDGRLLLLPVRSLTGPYRWVTCPYLIERFARDLTRAGSRPAFAIPKVEKRAVLCEGRDEPLFLEERQFEVAGAPAKPLVDALIHLIHHAETRARLPGQLAVLADEDFAWFARYGLPIQARNILDKGTKSSKNLWYEETLPPDTLLYALIAARSGDVLDELRGHVREDRYLQVGGNETVGHGWCVLRELEEDDDDN